MTLVVAHRGASADAPENTVAAFREAAHQGADWVELDVRSTADGVLVTHHAPVLADGRLLVEVVASDLPTDVPTLAEALDACGPMGVNVELKQIPGEADHDPTFANVEAVVAEVGRVARSGPLLLTSFWYEAIQHARTLKGAPPTGWLVYDAIRLPGALERVAADGHVAIHPWDEVVNDSLVVMSQAAGLAINVWTVDDPARMAQLGSWGVDGIITNRPALARATLDAHAAPG